MKKGILVDVSKFEIVKEMEYEDKRIDGMFLMVEGQLIPAAYIFPIENRNLVLAELETLKEMKKAYDDKVSYVYYKVFPKLRG